MSKKTLKTKAEKKLDRLDILIIKLKNALYDERNDHESCYYEFGCIVESEPLRKKWKVFISKELENQKKEMIERIKGMRKPIPNGIGYDRDIAVRNNFLDDIIQTIKK